MCELLESFARMPAGGRRRECRPSLRPHAEAFDDLTRHGSRELTSAILQSWFFLLACGRAWKTGQSGGELTASRACCPWDVELGSAGSYLVPLERGPFILPFFQLFPPTASDTYPPR